MSRGMKLLWVDDEIEGFRPHILFLEKEGIEVRAVDHPADAIKILEQESFDLILLDYRMPEMNGLELLKEVKKAAPHIPVALVTMVTDRDIIEDSIAEEVFDYIVKPVQPSQILALLKRLQLKEIKQRRLGKKLIEIYREIESLPQDYEGWLRKGRLFSLWRIEAEEEETLESELSAQNLEFARWIERNYPSLLKEESYTMSHNVVAREVLPELNCAGKVAFFVFDNFRHDQFMRMLKELPRSLKVEQKDYMALLPTATPYARNSLFAGILPVDIERRHPGWTKDNRHEIELMLEQLREKGYSWAKLDFKKINSLNELKDIHVGNADMEVYVVNFLDLLSHLRQEIQALKELSPDGEGFIRWSSFVLSESNLFDKFTVLAQKGYVIFLTSDHGWVEAYNPAIIQGGGELTRGLRYKFGDSVKPQSKGVLLVRELREYGLPSLRGQGRLALATDYAYFVYPSDPHRFEKRYKGGIYHGGISLEEMVIPLIKLVAA